MALIFFDGFEAWTSNTPEYPWASGNGITISSGVKRTGTYSADFGGNNYDSVNSTTFSATDTLIIGFAVRVHNVYSSGGLHFARMYFTDGGYMSMFFDDINNSLKITRNGTVLATGATDTVNLNQWVYVEYKVYSHATLGSAEIRVNGVTYASVSNTNTVPVASTTISYLQLGGSNYMQWFCDDLYVCDGSGTINNDFLDPVYVVALRPDSDSSVAFTPSTGIENFAMVDEVAADDATTYVHATVATTTDYYTLSNSPAEANVPIGVTASMRAAKGSGGVTKVAPLLKSGTTEVEGTTRGLDVSYINIHAGFYETDPDTGVAWTKTGVDALMVGQRVK